MFRSPRCVDGAQGTRFIMFQVAPLSREAVDRWPLSEAGLPTRVINSAKAANVNTIGELRNWDDSKLLKLRSLGRVSLEQIHSFFKLCNSIEKSDQCFSSIRDVLNIFLDAHQLNVISLRYGFHQRDLKPSRNRMTLQDIGNQNNKTRERIRQVEETGKQRLKSRLASVCLEPFYRFFQDFIQARSGAITAEELGALRGHEAVDELNPSSIALLLSDTHSELIRLHHGFFSTLPLSVINQIELKTQEILLDSNQPIGLDQLVANFSDHLTVPKQCDLRRAISVVLDHLPNVGSTITDLYFLYDTSVHSLLVEIMQNVQKPVHYRTVTNLFNDRVKPRSRKGAGYILDVLNKNSHCVRAERGIYTLGISTDLPSQRT